MYHCCGITPHRARHRGMLSKQEEERIDMCVCVFEREEPRAYLRYSLPWIPSHNIIWTGWKCHWISIAICSDPWGRLSNLSLSPTSTLTSNKQDTKWNLEPYHINLSHSDLDSAGLSGGLKNIVGMFCIKKRLDIKQTNSDVFCFSKLFPLRVKTKT